MAGAALWRRWRAAPPAPTRWGRCGWRRTRACRHRHPVDWCGVRRGVRVRGRGAWEGARECERCPPVGRWRSGVARKQQLSFSPLTHPKKLVRQDWAGRGARPLVEGRPGRVAARPPRGRERPCIVEGAKQEGNVGAVPLLDLPSLFLHPSIDRSLHVHTDNTYTHTQTHKHTRRGKPRRRCAPPLSLPLSLHCCASFLPPHTLHQTHFDTQSKKPTPTTTPHFNSPISPSRATPLSPSPAAAAWTGGAPAQTGPQRAPAQCPSCQCTRQAWAAR